MVMLCTYACSAAPAAPPSTSTAKKLSVGIAVPIGVLLLSLGVCIAFYLYSRRAKRQNPPDSFSKNGPEHGRSKSVKVVYMTCLTVLASGMFCRQHTA